MSLGNKLISTRSLEDAEGGELTELLVGGALELEDPLAVVGDVGDDR